MKEFHDRLGGVSDEDRVLASLEPDQLVSAKSRPLSRRHLKLSEILVLWFLRLYLLFMMGIVLYAVLSGSR